MRVKTKHMGSREQTTMTQETQFYGQIYNKHDELSLHTVRWFIPYKRVYFHLGSTVHFTLRGNGTYNCNV